MQIINLKNTTIFNRIKLLPNVLVRFNQTNAVNDRSIYFLNKINPNESVSIFKKKLFFLFSIKYIL